MLDDRVLDRVWEFIQEYVEGGLSVTYLSIAVITGIFLFEIWMAMTESLDSIRVFATGIFGVVPFAAWPLSPVLHRGPGHFIINVAGLFVLGVPIERHWERYRYSGFLILTGYFSIGAGAAFLSYFSTQQIAFYGASGIVFGLAGFALTYLPRSVTPLTRSETLAVLIGFAALLTVIIDFMTGPYFTTEWFNGGHLAGFVIGAGVGRYKQIRFKLQGKR